MRIRIRAVRCTHRIRSVHLAMSHQNLREQKTVLRKMIRTKLAKLSEADIASQSAVITKHVLALQQYQNANAIGVFLSMPGKEASTTEIVLDALRRGKEVFVPYIYSKGSTSSKSMCMLQIADEADLKSLQPDPWGIPSLSKDSVGNRRNALGGQGIEDAAGNLHSKAPKLDVIFMPAVAFDLAHNRLGHGKGFYDRYLEAFEGSADVTGSHMPLLAGLALREQLLPTNETIPHDESDWKVDLVVTPDPCP